MSLSGPVRTCVACRAKGTKGEFIKLASTPAGVVPDYMEKMPGRGAYVCAEPYCIKRALDERVLSRAFKMKTAAPEPEGFTGLLVMGMERRIRSLLGIARKSGLMRHGYDASVDEASKKPGGLLIIAADVSAKTRNKLGTDVPDALAGSASYSTRDELGGMLGTAPVGVLYISDRGLAGAMRAEFARLGKFNRG